MPAVREGLCFRRGGRLGVRDFFGGGGFSSGRFCSRDRFQLVLGIGAVMERAHCKQNYDHKGDGCQNDGKSGLPGIVFSAVIRRRRVLPLGGLLRGLPLSVLLLGLLDGLLRLLPLRGLLGLLLFCSAIGAEFHGFRDFFAAVVTIHVPLSFIF